MIYTFSQGDVASAHHSNPHVNQVVLFARIYTAYICRMLKTIRFEDPLARALQAIEMTTEQRSQ